MALVDCNECGGKVSEIAPNCPHCGYPRRTALIRVGLGGVALGVFLGILLFLAFAWLAYGLFSPIWRGV